MIELLPSWRRFAFWRSLTRSFRRTRRCIPISVVELVRLWNIYHPSDRHPVALVEASRYLRICLTNLYEEILMIIESSKFSL